MKKRHLTRTAVFVILERGTALFFLRRSNTGWGDGLLTFPSGHVDKGYSIREAAMQEVKEEACVDVQIEDLEFLHVDYMRDEYTNFYFRAKKWEGEPKLGEPHLASEALWIEWEAIPDDTIVQVRNFLEQSKAGSYFSEMVRHRC